MGLVERDDALAALDEQLAKARLGDGSVVLVHGEAGIGKTSLLRTWTGGLAGGVAYAWGACDPLSTPSPLAPLREVAAEMGGDVLTMLRNGGATLDIFAGFVAELRQVTRVVVFEDLHWADEATRDLVRYAGRRIGSTPSLLLLSVRDDELIDARPLDLVIGELARAGTLVRVPLPPLSRAGVEELVAGQRGDADVVFHRTGGNPFFVAEVIRNADAPVPDTVRDAVLARLFLLDDRARTAVETLACVPGRVNDALASELVDDPSMLDELITGGLLVHQGRNLAFRHELVRLAVVDTLSVHRRRTAHSTILDALERRGDADMAALTHHAVGAGADSRVTGYARRAASEAATAGAHREASSFLSLALHHGDDLDASERAELLEALSYELYLTDRVEEGITARDEAVRLRSPTGEKAAVGSGHRWLSRLSWIAGRRAQAEYHAELAVELLEGTDEVIELGFAYSNRAQLGMLKGNEDEAVHWGERALDIASRLGDTDLRVHALNNMGTALDGNGDEAGRAMLLESISVARERGMHEHAARGYTNITWNDVEQRRLARAEPLLREALAYTTQRDLDTWSRYMLGCRARLHLLRGRLTAAGDDAAAVLAEAPSSVSRIWPLMIIGLVRTRRGDPGGGELLAEAWGLALDLGEVGRLAPLAAARAEHSWVVRAEPPLDDLRDLLRRAAELRAAWPMAEAAGWLHRLGSEVDAPSDVALPEPYVLELAGESRAAAEAWRGLGCPYEAAIALADSGAGEDVIEALESLTELGAEGAARRVRHQLRTIGVSRIPRGPRPATRANPARLTARQVEVVNLLAAGLSNAEIADELVISTRTAEHHVSAIFDKLGARTRVEAGRIARDLGLVD